MNKENNSALLKLNKFFSYCIVLWACIPWLAQNLGLMVGMMLVALWAISAWLCNGGKFTFRKDGIVMVVWAGMSLFSYVFFGHIYIEMDFLYYVPMMILFFIPYYITYFYMERKEFQFLARLVVVAMFGMLIGEITSIYYSSIVPGIMKSIDKLAVGTLDAYRKSGIGAFGFVYMVMFSIVSVFVVFKKIKIRWIRVFMVVFCIIGVVCLFESTYTTSILFLIIGLILIKISNLKDKTMKYACYILLPILFLALASFLGNLLLNISLGDKGMTERLHEIGQFLVGGEVGDNLEGRFDRIKKSFECFLHYPLFGYNFQSNPNYVVGTHCEWVDIFAVYGLIGAIPVFGTLVFKLKYINEIVKEKLNINAYGAIILILVFYGFIDPIMRIYHTGMAMFLIVPGIFCLPKLAMKEGKNENMLDS